MASQMDVHSSILYVGLNAGSTELPLLYIPAEGGGVTILDAYMTGGAGTSVGGVLVNMTNPAGGTPVTAGTIGSLAGTVVQAAGVVAAFTLTTPFVDGGQWIGFDQSSGSVPVGTFINITYVTGKG